jgi:acetoacetate decarboxylase
MFMFKFDPKSFYQMPCNFGPRAQRGSALYNDVTTIAVSYLTDRKLLANYLPEPFEVGAEPLVSIAYSLNNDIDWLAGGRYNIVGVNASVVFKGKVDEVAGGYCLVMWENLTDPILTGRELQGIPKIYADIPDHTVVDGIWRVVASYRGHKIVDMTVKGLKALPADEVKKIETMAKAGNWMGWKYIPKTGEPGAEVSHATLYPTDPTYKEAWVGTGEVAWNSLTWEQNPNQSHIVNALKALPILEYRSAIILKGSSNLMVPDKPVRALR